MSIVNMLPQSGGSSEETLTELWVNNSPTESLANGNKTLNESMSGYKRIRIVYRPFTATDEVLQGVVDIPVEYIPRFQNEASQPYGGLCGWGSSYQYVRGFYVPQANLTTLDVIYFLHCYRINASNTSDNYCVPLYIYGIK